jgi:hypothetical protein
MSPRAVVLLLALGCGASGGDRSPVSAEPPRPPPRPPSFEVDHLWIVATPDAPERVAFERAGFQVAPQVNHHEGQGTASITVELDNGFLELIYVDDAVPVAPNLERVKAQFQQRAAWRTSGYSPLGIAVRRLAGAPAAFPFPTWKVTAAWVPEGKFIEILTPRDTPTALRLFVPAHPSIGPDADPVDPATRIHPNRSHRLTAVRVVSPSAEQLPPAARYLADHGAAAFELGAEWLLDVTLDDGAQHVMRDLRPTLPMVIRY